MQLILKKMNKVRNLLAVVSCSLVVVIMSMSTVHAGLFSSVFPGEKVSAKVSVETLTYSSRAVLPMAAVNIDPNPDKAFDAVPVSGGETLIADIASTNSSESTKPSNLISIYTVQEGDTIASIAKMFNVSRNTVLWANDLNSKSTIRVGQTLTILPVTGVKYTIRKDDTVVSIAKKFRADVNEIYNYNDLDSSNKLVIGQSIIIPDGDITTSSVVVRALNGMIVPDDPLLVNISKLPSYAGYYNCPVYGARLSQSLHGRNAIDLAAPVGTPILASADGVVMISKSNGTWNGGYGHFIVISHNNGTQTLYAHMQKSIVNVGDKVSQGQKIGYIGISGMTTGPHLHYEIRGARNPFASGACH